MLSTYLDEACARRRVLLDSRPQILDAFNQEANTLSSSRKRENENLAARKRFLGTYFFSSEKYGCGAGAEARFSSIIVRGRRRQEERGSTGGIARRATTTSYEP